MTAEVRFLANNKSPLTVLEALVKHNSLKIEITMHSMHNLFIFERLSSQNNDISIP